MCRPAAPIPSRTSTLRGFSRDRGLAALRKGSRKHSPFFRSIEPPSEIHKVARALARGLLLALPRGRELRIIVDPVSGTSKRYPELPEHLPRDCCEDPEPAP